MSNNLSTRNPSTRASDPTSTRTQTHGTDSTGRPDLPGEARAADGVDVVFIDKYIDPQKSAVLLNKLQEKFQFNDAKKQQLASGYPVVIKRNADANSAQALVEYIARLGGDCWLQASDPEGFSDRRAGNRRQVADRRLLHRGWAIMPDRRKRRERRVFFH